MQREILPKLVCSSSEAPTIRKWKLFTDKLTARVLTVQVHRPWAGGSRHLGRRLGHVVAGAQCAPASYDTSTCKREKSLREKDDEEGNETPTLFSQKHHSLSLVLKLNFMSLFLYCCRGAWMERRGAWAERRGACEKRRGAWVECM